MKTSQECIDSGDYIRVGDLMLLSNGWCYLVHGWRLSKEDSATIFIKIMKKDNLDGFYNCGNITVGLNQDGELTCAFDNRRILNADF